MHISLTPKILIIESQMIIAADISLQFSKLGYEVLGISTCLEDALPSIQGTPPDIVILNIGSGSETAGIKDARTILESSQIPVVYLSANTGKEVLEATLVTKPYAFISKPFDQKDLKRGIETALRRMAAEGFWEKKRNNVP